MSSNRARPNGETRQATRLAELVLSGRDVEAKALAAKIQRDNDARARELAEQQRQARAERYFPR